MGFDAGRAFDVRRAWGFFYGGHNSNLLVIYTELIK
jgi:hypothetical protein